MALAALLEHPPIVCVSEYVAASVTVIDEVVDPLLHVNDPANDPAVNKEFPQLLTTLMLGTAGIGLGADTVLATGLVHPLIVCVSR